MNLYVFAFTYPFESVSCFQGMLGDNYGGFVFVVVVLVDAGVVGIVVVVAESVTSMFETVFSLV